MLSSPIHRRLQAALKEGVAAVAAASPSMQSVADADTPETVLDAGALRVLGELDPTGSNRLLERIFATFETSAQRLMTQLHDAQKAGDPGGVRHVAHTLKSSSASIGALELSRLCAEIETMIRLDAADGLALRIDRMDREVAMVLRALRKLPAGTR